jgi:hypothetical protein
LLSWEFVSGPTVWTEKAKWTALSAILGASWFGDVHPGHALELAQVFTGRGAPVSSSMLMLLHVPASRQGGCRRVGPVSGFEVADLLDAGVPASLVGDVAALGFTGAQAGAGLRGVRRLGLPADALVRAGELFPPEECVTVLTAAVPGSALGFAQTMIAAAERSSGWTLGRVAGALSARALDASGGSVRTMGE